MLDDRVKDRIGYIHREVPFRNSKVLNTARSGLDLVSRDFDAVDDEP